MELSILLVLTLGLGIGALGAVLGWLAARPAQTRLQTELEKDRAVHAERLSAYADAELKLRTTFQALSAEALKTNNQAFLDLAETRLREARTEATVDIDARKQAIENLLGPMAKTLDQVNREIMDAERRRVESGAALMERIASLGTAGEDLRSQTARLVDALKRPGVRGRWVRLPGGKHVVIDAKVPLDAYLRALEAPDEAARQLLLADHARQVRVHLTQLSSKAYAAHVRPSPDFVVMFLPGEMFFSAALEQDPGLIEFGVNLDQHVILASPTTLIALLRAVAYGWQQQAMEENARKISDLGRNLYESIRSLGSHFDTLGARLKSSLDAYNQAVGSLEGNVLVKARKFKELQAANGGEEIKTLEPVDRVPRMLQAPELTGGLPFAADDVVEVAEIERV